MQQVVIPQERNSERITELTVVVPIPQDMKGIEIEYLAPAPAVARRRRTSKILAPALAAACAAPDRVLCVASSPAVAYAAPTPVSEHVAPTPAVSYAAPAPLIEYVASEPAVTFSAPASMTEYVAP